MQPPETKEVVDKLKVQLDVLAKKNGPRTTRLQKRIQEAVTKNDVDTLNQMLSDMKNKSDQCQIQPAT